MTDQELIAPDLPEQRDPKKAQLKPGWYKVADSNDIGSMEAIQVDDFPTQIVVWRGKDDQLSALDLYCSCLLYTSPSPRDLSTSRMPSSA